MPETETETTINAFTELFGKIPDAEIANLADVDVDDVADAREAAGIEPFEEPQPPEPEPDPEPEPAPRRKGKGKGAAKVAKAVAEAAVAVAPLVIRLLRTVRFTVRTPKGRLLSMTLPQSVYRGEMAERVMGLVHPEDRDAIERIS